ncbi:MAG: radical SAM protein, partial [Proteobacteria bacterium]|nr:radical SAM protein [Pseudomonadota bacterium]
MNVVLLSTYDLGHQPFGLASPAAWLRQAGASVTCNDLAVDDLDEQAVRDAGLIAVYLPMHTATRLAGALVPRLKRLNPTAHVCFYGLYAPLNE